MTVGSHCSISGSISGAFAGPLITGLLQTSLGFHYGFGAAAVGMALGLTQYVVFRRNLGEHGRTVRIRCPAMPWRSAAVAAAVVAVVVVGFVTGLVTLANLSQVTTLIIVLASVGYFAVMLTSPRRRVNAPGSGVHPAVHRQRGVLVAVPADLRGAGGLLRRADQLDGVRLDRTVELDRVDGAGLDHLLSPVFAVLWTKLGRRAPHPRRASSPTG